MLYEEALEIVNRALSENLTDAHKAILPLLWDNNSYGEMSLKINYEYSYITDVGAELFKLLSQVFNFKVTKLNFCSSVVRYAEQKQMYETLASSQSNRVDWGEAPDTSQFFGRQAELKMLNQWVMKDRCKVVAIAGSAGIGKTTLATQLTQQLVDTGQFDIVVWRSLRQAPPLSDFLTQLISALVPEQLPQTAPEAAMRQLIEQLRDHRCLLIINGIEAVLAPNKLAGTYQLGYRDYELLFQRLGEVKHQSCTLLTCREIPSEVMLQEGAIASVRLLRLEALSVEECANILATKGLLLSELSQMREIIMRFQGNPLVLKMVATVIKELFNGDFNIFLTQETWLFKDIRELLAQQFHRLSLVERQVMYWLAINQKAVTVAQLEADLLPLVSRLELQDALVSLDRRSLIKKIKPPSANLTSVMSSDSVGYTQQPLVMAYVKEQLRRCMIKRQ